MVALIAKAGDPGEFKRDATREARFRSKKRARIREASPSEVAADRGFAAPVVE
jgi:hypothetical protein